MCRRAPTSLLAALLPGLLLASLPASSGATPSASFAPCAREPAFACASVNVPLDRGGTVPGTVSLSVERRSAAAGPSSVAVVALAGGPGQATLPLAPLLAQALAHAPCTR